VRVSRRRRAAREVCGRKLVTVTSHGALSPECGGLSESCFQVQECCLVTRAGIPRLLPTQTVTPAREGISVGCFLASPNPAGPPQSPAQDGMSGSLRKTLSSHPTRICD
jgi:hypothetical protein